MDVEDEMNNGEIYAEVMKFCEPVKAPAPWSRFVMGSDFFRPPADETELHETLRMKYGRRALRRSRVMTVGPQKRLVLNPRLSMRPNVVMPLRTTQSGKPFDLLTSEGTVSGRLPVHEAARDHLMGEGDKRNGLVFATFNIHDAMVLRAVGAPAVLASGLDRFTARTLAQFRTTFGTTAEPAVTPPLLVLVGWTPSRMSRTRSGPFLDNVIRNIVNGGDCFGLRVQDVLLWQPTIEEIQRLSRCLQIGHLADVANALLHSFNQSAKPLAPREDEAGPGAILEQARTRLRKTMLNANATRGARRRRLREYREAVEEVLVKPLLAQAMQETDLLMQSRLLALVEANRELHYGSVGHAVKLERLELQGGALTDEILLENRQVLAKVDAVCKLAKEK